MKRLILLTLCAITIYACSKDEEEPITEPTPGEEVQLDLSLVPYTQLSDYQLFTGALRDMIPNEGVLHYDLISHLFTDYAKKNRYIWMPEGSQASYSEDGEVLQFPTGTVIVKTFYYDHVQPADERRILETRLLIRQEEEWMFAEYVWNDEQTDATLYTAGDNIPLDFIDDNGTARSINYRIPSVDGNECFTCHKVDNFAMPIGPKPQNLNKDWTYGSATMNQLEKWKQVGYLASDAPTPSEENTVVEWEDESFPLEARVRSYIDINCGHCHAGGRYCDYRPMRFSYEETVVPENLGVCVEPDEGIAEQPSLTHIVARGNLERSMLHYRFSSTEENVRMPLLGRRVVHDEALEMIEDWILSLDPPCD